MGLYEWEFLQIKSPTRYQASESKH